MGTFIIKRLGQSLVVVILVTIIAFALLHSLPGGAARATLGKEATQEQIDQFNHDNGFDLPIAQQYVRYVGEIAQGDFGYSYKLNQDVSDAINQRLPKTILLSLISTILAIALAVPLGVWQAVNRNRGPDYTITIAAMLAYSTPDLLSWPPAYHLVLTGVVDPAARSAAGLHGLRDARRSQGPHSPGGDTRHRHGGLLLALRAFLHGG